MGHSSSAAAAALWAGRDADVATTYERDVLGSRGMVDARANLLQKPFGSAELAERVAVSQTWKADNGNGGGA